MEEKEVSPPLHSTLGLPLLLQVAEYTKSIQRKLLIQSDTVYHLASISDCNTLYLPAGAALPASSCPAGTLKPFAMRKIAEEKGEKRTTRNTRNIRYSPPFHPPPYLGVIPIPMSILSQTAL